MQVPKKQAGELAGPKSEEYTYRQEGSHSLRPLIYDIVTPTSISIRHDVQLGPSSSSSSAVRHSHNLAKNPAEPA
jgi:hypothetical protein